MDNPTLFWQKNVWRYYNEKQQQGRFLKFCIINNYYNIINIHSRAQNLMFTSHYLNDRFNGTIEFVPWYFALLFLSFQLFPIVGFVSPEQHSVDFDTYVYAEKPVLHKYKKLQMAIKWWQPLQIICCNHIPWRFKTPRFQVTRTWFSNTKIYFKQTIVFNGR